MTDDPLERVTEVFADAGERLVEYADVLAQRDRAQRQG